MRCSPAANRDNPLFRLNGNAHGFVSWWADTKLGEAVDLIKLRGMYNETLVVFTSDNVK